MRRPRREQIVAGIAALLLAVFAIQQLGVLRDRARRERLRQDLLRLALAQESYHYDRKVYGADPADVAEWGFRPRADADIVVREATAVGWSAVARHREGAIRCYLYVRDAAPLGPATSDGVVTCR